MLLCGYVDKNRVAVLTSKEAMDAAQKKAGEIEKKMRTNSLPAARRELAAARREQKRNEKLQLLREASIANHANVCRTSKSKNISL